MESTIRTKILAGAGMVCISTTASQAASGGFKYSTTGAICMAEFVKLAMSASFHLFDKSHGQSLQVTKAISNAKEQLSFYAFRHIYFLAILYMINNQLSFYIYTMVDPGTVFLFKAASTMIVAAVQCTFAGKKFTWEQWKAMMLQACGMITVQYDPCKGAGVYSPFAYGCLCLSTAITAISAARNEFLAGFPVDVKNFQITLNVQNAVLYSGGVIFNLLAFLLLPNPNSKNANIGFFEGYDLLAIGVVCSNALIGIVITAVYKYADAVVKCIASDITAVLLIILSSFFFGLHSSLTMWCGVFTVTFAVHLYIDASSKVSAKPNPEGSGQSSQTPAKTELTSMVGREARENEDAADEEAESLVRKE